MVLSHFAKGTDVSTYERERIILYLKDVSILNWISEEALLGREITASSTVGNVFGAGLRICELCSKGALNGVTNHSLRN
jgi:hypothetical protein